MKENGRIRTAKSIEGLVFVLFLLSFVLVSICHEPWYDEALAWQIARSGTLWDILFSVPHYEGHPPFWYLLLSIPAKLGVPYELGMKSVSGIATIGGVWLLLFRSPFPRLIRCILPFQYFLFYQYGVIARPYSYFFLLFLLLAMLFPKKGEQPFRFVACLAGICACSGYGIVLAGGIAAAWLYEICAEKEWKIGSKGFWKDRRILALLCLLLAAMLMVAQILPAQDSYAVTREPGNGFLKNWLYTFFMMLPDSTFMSILGGSEFLKYHSFSGNVLAIGCFAGAAMYGAILLFSGKKELKYYLIPNVLFSVFSAAVYFCAHHMGISVVFLLFWVWIVLEHQTQWEMGKPFFERIGKLVLEKERRLLSGFFQVLGLFILGVSVLWTVSSSRMDVQEPYYYARGAANFLREHGLENSTMMAEWDEDNKEDGEDPLDGMDTNLVSIPVSILPYLDQGVCVNLNHGAADMAYVTHRVASPEENKRNLEMWAEWDFPELLLGNVDLEAIYTEKSELPRYLPVYRLDPFYANIWKGTTCSLNQMAYSFIFLREDLLDVYGVERLK